MIRDRVDEVGHYTGFVTDFCQNIAIGSKGSLSGHMTVDSKNSSTTMC